MRGLREGPFLPTDADAHRIVSMTSYISIERHVCVLFFAYLPLQTCSDSNQILLAYKSYRTHGVKPKLITRPTLHSVRNSLSVVDSAGLSRTYPRHKGGNCRAGETLAGRNRTIPKLFYHTDIFCITNLRDTA